jgi:hypothetical protein
VPSVVPIGTLTHSELMSEMSGLATAISTVSDISLSEVQDWYFGRSDTDSDMDQRMADERYLL